MNTKKIRDLNDAFRRDLFNRKLGRVLWTAAVNAEGPGFLGKCLEAIKDFDDFTNGNDPWNENDFGALDVDGKKIFFKIDYYDPTMTAGSEDPSDPTKTTRVLTIMFPEDY